VPTRLILIRHGETDYSLEKRYCSFTDVALNDKGIEQAESLCQKLASEKIDRIYSSDSKRTKEFAKIVFNNRPLEVVSELKEMNFGIFEGLTHEEIMERYAEIYKKWLGDPFKTAIPKGDTLIDFKERIEKILKRIVSLNKDKTLAIVTHAGPIKIIIGNIRKSKNIWDINPELGSFESYIYE
jgi:broad specificity phosphatase PhoE